MKTNGFTQFDSVFVISLPDMRDRRARMLAQMQELGIDNFTMLEAVDGRSLDQETMIQSGDLVLNDWIGRYLNAGELGCLLSHIRVWQTILEKGVRTAIVLEDDVELRLDAPALLDEIMGEMPSNWDIIHLHSTVAVGCGEGNDKGRTRLSDHVWKGNAEGGGTVAYALSARRGVVEFLLELVRPLKYAADGYTNWPTGAWTGGKWNGYIIHPFLCSHGLGKSAIWQRGSKPSTFTRIWRRLRR